MQKIKLIDEYIYANIRCEQCDAELIVKTIMTSKWMNGRFENVLDLEVPRCGCELKKLVELEAENDE